MKKEERDYLHKEIDTKWISNENIPDNMSIGELKAFAAGIEYALMCVHDIIDDTYRKTNPNE